ncbi:hypothetical protein HN876_02565 [archaeon]|jgi:hypothetical protein|nr:hypothetical protein [archaeon]MBT7251775.1 hypothetical protein [archaeon]
MKVTSILLATAIAVLPFLSAPSQADANLKADQFDRLASKENFSPGGKNLGLGVGIVISSGQCSGAPNSENPNGAFMSLAEVQLPAGDFIRIHVDGVPINKSMAIMFNGPSSQPTNLWNGYLCEVLFGISHMGVVMASNQGIYEVDVPRADFMALLVHDTMSFQAVYRDPGVGDGGNLSNSILVTTP